MFFRDIKPPAERESKTKLLLRMVLAGNEAGYARRRDTTILVCTAFAVILFIALLYWKEHAPRLKEEVTKNAGAAFENILQGTILLENKNFDQAKKLFKEAGGAFQKIEQHAVFTQPKFALLQSDRAITDPVFDAGRRILNSGKLLAAAGESFTDLTGRLALLPKMFFEKNKRPELTEKISLTEKLKNELPLLAEAVQQLQQANEEIQGVPLALVPKDLTDRFRFARDALSALSKLLGNLEHDLPAILTLLGDRQPHTFLILLQNNAELRPSGGFIGNFAIAETNDGYVTKNEVFDVYSADHKLNEILEPPPEILPVNPRWFLRDANYSGHFPISAQKTAWFLEKEGGPGVDTVIAVDASFMAELLRLAKPISIPGLPAKLTAENFATVISFIVEAKLSGREDPKAILRSILPSLQTAVFKNIEPAQLAPVLRRAVSEKHLLGYSKDPSIQDFFESIGMTGIMKEPKPKEDYLNIVHTSIGGNKSDSYVTETIVHDTYLKQNGAVTDELTITRTHEWNWKTEENIKRLLASFGFQEVPRSVLDILGGTRNLHKLRIYVPKGAKLLESSVPGVTEHQDPETQKTYFSAAMETPVNQSATLRVRYSLPWKLSINPVDTYALTVQKQAGQKNIFLEKRIFAESGIQNYTYFPKTGSFDADGVWSVKMPVEKDESFTSVWGK